MKKMINLILISIIAAVLFPLGVFAGDASPEYRLNDNSFITADEKALTSRKLQKQFRSERRLLSQLRRK